MAAPYTFINLGEPQLAENIAVGGKIWKLPLIGIYGGIGPVSISGSLPPGTETIGGVVQKPSAFSAPIVIFDDAGSIPTLQNLASGALALSGVINNGTKLDDFLALAFNVTGAAAFNNPATCSLWILPSLDGTKYEDGAGTDPVAAITPARAPDFTFNLRDVDTAQLLVITGLAIPPGKFKILLRNDSNTGQSFTNVDVDNFLTGYTHSGPGL